MFKVFVAGSTIYDLKKNLLQLGHSLSVKDVPDDAHVMYGSGTTAPESEEEQNLDNDESVPTSAPVASPVVAPHTQTLNGEPLLDARGVQWDGRIHAATRATNKDGSWRTRRGVDEAEVARLEVRPGNDQQIPQTNANVATENAANPGPAPMASIAPPFAVNAPAPFAFTSTFVPPVVVAPVAPVVAPVTYEPAIHVPQHATKPAHTLDTFRANFIPTLGQLVQNGAINQDYIETLKAYFKVKEIFDVNKNDAQASTLFESLVSHGLITKVG